MLGRDRTLVVILLALAGAVLAGVLLLQHHGEGQAVAAVNAVCAEGTRSGCDEVNRSAYAEVGGVPLAAVGLVFSLSLAALLALALFAGAEVRGAAAVLALAALGAALAVDLVLLGLQAFAIKAFCRLCLTTYALNAVAFVLLWPARRSLKDARAAFSRAEGRLAAAGWALATLALVAAAATADALLEQREARRAATILGAPATTVAKTPTPSIPPAPAASAEPPAPADAARDREQARAAQAELRRLQEILDNPDKLQQYMADKAAHEFDAAPVRAIDVARTPLQGPPQAPVRVVTYSDFLCPWCRNLASGLASFLPQSGGRVALYFKNYPLDQSCNPNLKSSVHAGACWLALGGVCAHEQGRFWVYHDAVFGAPLSDPTREDVLKLASGLGFGAEAFEACLGAPRTRERLDAEIAEARKVGVEATPTIFVNGKKLPGINTFLSAVEKELKRQGLPPLPPMK